MTDNGFVGNASHIYPRIVQPAPEATSDRDKMCQIISEAVGGWNQNTQAITRVAAALSDAGFGLVADAKAEALEEAADKIMGPSDVPLDGATCRWVAMGLRENAQALRAAVAAAKGDERG